MFYNYQRFEPQLNTLLQNPDVTLEQIFDQDILPELKDYNSYLFGNYVTQNPQVFEKMLSYLNVDERNTLEKEMIRYPFFISEIIGSNNEIIIDHFFTDDGNHLAYLFGIIDQDCLNVTVAGYFANVVSAIIRRRGPDVWAYLNLNQHIISNLIKHMDVFHIAQVVEQLILLSSHQDCCYQDRTQLICRLIGYMEAKYYVQDVVENCGYILGQVLVNDEQQLFLEHLCTPERYFYVAVKSGSSQALTLILILLDQLQRYILKRREQHTNYEFNYYQFFQLANEFDQVLLYQPTKQGTFMTSYGSQQMAFSYFRIKLLEIYLYMLKLKDLPLLQQFHHQYIYEILLKFLGDHEFNNSLQTLFYDITVSIFQNMDLGQIQQAAYVSLSNFIIQHNQLEKQDYPGIRFPIKRGYCGILNKLSYYFEQVFTDESWIEYQQRLLPTKSIEFNYFFGINPHPVFEQEQAIDLSRKELLDKVHSFQQQSEQQQSTEQPQEQVQIQLSTGELVNSGNLVEAVLTSPKASPKDVELAIEDLNLLGTVQENEPMTENIFNQYWRTHYTQEQQPTIQN